MEERYSRTTGNFGWGSALIGAVLYWWPVAWCYGPVHCPEVMRHLFIAFEGSTSLQLEMHPLTTELS